MNAYEEWRTKYSKGEFDSLRYPNFRKNYIKLMNANAAELTVARDMGYPDPVPLSLNEFGDLLICLEFKAKLGWPSLAKP